MIQVHYWPKSVIVCRQNVMHLLLIVIDTIFNYTRNH